MSIFEVDVTNMRKLMAARPKSFIINELIQNGWDATGTTRVDVTLTEPDANGHSILTVTDDAPKGWETLSHAYTMYAESSKTNDPTKRGRFNEGEKAVVCLNIEASVTTVSGQIRFQGADKRWETDEHTTMGSIFSMKFELSQADYMDICRKALLLIPPKDIATTFNGKEIRKQGATHMFDTRLRTPLNGRNEPRKCEVRLYECAGKPWLYEMGIPIMELTDDKWSINVMQKVPLGRDRNSVPLTYVNDVRVAIVNKYYSALTKEDATRLSVQAAVAHPKSSDAAVRANVVQRFGEKFALEDQKDKGANLEFVSQGGVVIQRNDVSSEMKKRLRTLEDETDPSKPFVQKTGDITPTNVKIKLDKIVNPENYDADTKHVVDLATRLAPRLIDRDITVNVINDNESHIAGCFEYIEGVMHINLAYHDTSDMEENFELIIHEFAHNTLHGNEHLKDVFYKTEEEIAGKLAVLALEEPELFSRWHGEIHQETEMSEMSAVGS
jgi:hypothetical protein